MASFKVTLFDRRDSKMTWEIVFQHYPSYLEILRRLPNEARKVLAQDRGSVKFMGDGGSGGFSTPLFTNNPTGVECYASGFPCLKNLIGRLTVWPIKIYP